MYDHTIYTHTHIHSRMSTHYIGLNSRHKTQSALTTTIVSVCVCVSIYMHRSATSFHGAWIPAFVVVSPPRTRIIRVVIIPTEVAACSRGHGVSNRLSTRPASRTYSSANTTLCVRNTYYTRVSTRSYDYCCNARVQRCCGRVLFLL